MTLFWLSFVDPDRPKGTQFLGACIVRGVCTGIATIDMDVAIRAAWTLGCNPGGAVQATPIPEAAEEHIDPKWIGRLLSREECEALDHEMKAKRAN